ncbi:MAG: TrkH family potassium uptake protein [Clostridium thermopalmarium]|uniref:TrkH family potassium uptake protein n=1 Tax=Clostridium thermopalmarium TaxID=29373 RepID=UPI002352A3F5|nr:TrkH family potassium uptake protein [Clostridium thermopalmarium]MBE6043629.1 TrkH family potassium uptake protein [Clostridium thermopalmarium]
MNYGMVLKSLGRLLICEGLVMIPSFIVALIYNGGNDERAFLITIAILFIVGLLAARIKPKRRNIYARDGFAIVAIGWLLAAFFGAFPFVLSGAIPSFIDAFFETTSGLTTTGSSILKDVESLPNGLLFWRSFAHWIGGMGVLVMTLAILPSAKAGTLQIMKAESPGPNPGKLVPKVGQTAKILYGIYGIITIIEVILLKVAGMPLFDSLIHTFGTVGTGGFSSKGLSVGAYNNIYVEIIITIFTFACGVNFSLYYQAIKGNIKEIFKDEEFRFYLGIVLVSIVLITLNLYGNIFKTIGESLRHSSFQVVTIITTTGYSTTDFNLWPTFSKMILLTLMFIGGCAGSTSGGIKNIRILLLFKVIKREILKVVHPKAVYTIKVDGKSIDEETLMSVGGFFFIYMIIFIFSIFIVSLDGFDMTTSISAVAATLGNIGPGFGMVGPMGSFSEFSVLSKIVMSLDMIIGRLEIYPILLLVMPTLWKK